MIIRKIVRVSFRLLNDSRSFVKPFPARKPMLTMKVTQIVEAR